MLIQWTRRGRLASLRCMAFFVIGMLLSGCGGGAQRHLQTGIKTLREGDFAAAATLFELAAESQPDNPSVHCNLGLAYWKLGQTSRAIRALKTADRLSRSDERPLEFLGQIHIAEGDLEEARRTFERAAQRAPLSARILTSQAVVANYAGDVERARDLLDRALELNSAYAPALYNMGVLYRGPLNDPDVAATYFRRYLRLGPDAERVEAVREWMAALDGAEVQPPGRSATQPARPAPEAVVAPEGAAPPKVSAPPDRARPDTPPAPRSAPAADPAADAIAKARRAMDNDELDTALILLSRAVQQTPESAEALWLLAVLYDQHLAYDEEAAESYRTFRERFPNDPRTKTIPSPVTQEPTPAPEPEPAPKPPSTRASETPARDPDAARHALRQGVRFYQTREWSKAIAAYKQALSLDTGMVDAVYNLGLAYKGAGHVEDARAAFRQAIGLNADLLSAHYMLAVVSRELGDLDAARKELEGVIERDPHYAKAHLLLGLVYRDLERDAEARRHIKRYINMEPDSRFVDELKTWLESEGGS